MNFLLKNKAVRCALSIALPAGILVGMGSMASGAEPAAAPSITLANALEYALTRNADVQRLAMRVDEKAWGLQGAEAALLPVAFPVGDMGVSESSRQATYGAGVRQKAPWGTQAEVKGVVDTLQFEGQDASRRSRVVVSLEQPLFRNAGSLVQQEPVRRAESARMAARREYAIFRTDLIVNVAQGYEALYRLQIECRYAGESLERLNRLYYLTRVREAQGRTSRLEALRAEQKKGNAEIRLVKAREQEKRQQAEFAGLLGFPPEQLFTLQSCPVLGVTLLGFAPSEVLALSNRLDYAQILADYEDARRGVAVARHYLLPDLNAITRYEWRDNVENAGNNPEWARDGWFVGLAARSDWPPREEQARLEQAKISAQLATLEIETVRRAIGRQVRETIRAYERLAAEVPLAEQSFALAGKRAQLARRLFEMGRGNSQDVMDAEEALQTAETQLLVVQSDSSVAGYQLLRAMGILEECPADLKAPGRDVL